MEKISAELDNRLNIYHTVDHTLGWYGEGIDAKTIGAMADQKHVTMNADSQIYSSIGVKIKDKEIKPVINVSVRHANVFLAIQRFIKVTFISVQLHCSIYFVVRSVLVAIRKYILIRIQNQYTWYVLSLWKFFMYE